MRNLAQLWDEDFETACEMKPEDQRLTMPDTLKELLKKNANLQKVIDSRIHNLYFQRAHLNSPVLEMPEYSKTSIVEKHKRKETK